MLLVESKLHLSWETIEVPSGTVDGDDVTSGRWQRHTALWQVEKSYGRNFSLESGKQKRTKSRTRPRELPGSI